MNQTIQVSQHFRNTHVANDLLSKDWCKLEKPPPIIKSYSTAKWNDVVVLWESVLANKDLIGSVFTSQMILNPTVRDMDQKPSF